MDFPFLLVAFLLITEILAALILGFYDFRHRNLFEQRHLVICLLFAITVFQGLILLSTGLFGLELMLFGAILWLAFGALAKGDIRHLYKDYAKLDRYVLLVSALTFPTLFLMAMIIHQALCMLVAGMRREPVKLPILTIYAGSFILAVAVIGMTVGLTVVYL